MHTVCSFGSAACFPKKECMGQDGRSGHRRPLQLCRALGRLCRALPGSRQALLGSAGLGFGSRLPVPRGSRAPCPGEARPLSPASQHQLLLRRPGPNFGVNVHREQSTGAVKNGCQGAHKGGQHNWQHQTPQTWNTEMGTGMSIPWRASVPGTRFSSHPFFPSASSGHVWHIYVRKSCLTFSCWASRAWKRLFTELLAHRYFFSECCLIKCWNKKKIILSRLFPAIIKIIPLVCRRGLICL